MSACCDPTEYAKVFDEKNAKSDARSYRKKGLDSTARRMIDFIVARGIAGASVLEVGGGVGAIQIELLRAGAARAANVEIVGTYEEAAAALLREHGLEGRVDRRVFDFAQDPEAVEPAEVVMLHRVVCCYPDMERMVRAAASRARRLLAMSFPPDRWWWRLWEFLEVAWFRLRGCRLGGYFHDPKAIAATARAAGLRPVYEHRGLVWQVAILERVAA